MTTEQATRTPGPWKTEGAQVLSDQCLYPVAICEGGTPDEGEANAAFIVRACNAHDDQVAALEAALTLVGRGSRNRASVTAMEHDAVQRQIRAALKLAPA